MKSYLKAAMVIGLLGGPVCGFLTSREFQLSHKGNRIPREIRLIDLANGGPPANLHVRVTDFEMGPSFVVKPRGSHKEGVVIPIFPPGVPPRGENIRVVLSSSRITDEGGSVNLPPSTR